MKQMFLLFALATLVFAPAKANFHKYYVSISEIAYNPDEKRVEVGMKVFFDDLQQGILIEQNEGITDPLSDFEDEISTYILNHFKVKNGEGELAKFTFVGYEDEMDAVWLYFESDKIDYTDEWTVRNTVFVDLFEQQTNLINFYPDKYDMSEVQGLLLSIQEKEGQVYF